jgi:hypothetical protein
LDFISPSHPCVLTVSTEVTYSWNLCWKIMYFCIFWMKQKGFFMCVNCISG